MTSDQDFDEPRLHGQGYPATEELACPKILKSQLRHSEAIHTLGTFAAQRDDWPAALRCFRRAVLLQANEPRYHNSLAIALWFLGRHGEAMATLDRALVIFPGVQELVVHRARLLSDMGKWPTAAKALEDALPVARKPGPILWRLADALGRLGRLSESEARWREFLRTQPSNGPALNNLAGVLCGQGRIEEANELFGRAQRIPEVSLAAGSNLLFTLHYHDSISPETIFRTHRAWAKRVERNLRSCPPRRRPPRRTLRVGYVSGDFRRQSVACFFEPLLENHDTRRVDVHCFSTCAREDATTARLKKNAAWHNISTLDDEHTVDVIRKAKIDILVDLSGHTAGNRLPVFARKPAPIEVTYIGYPDTTGLHAMDYRLTDSIADPPGMTERLHSESLVRVDPCFLCYRPPLRRVSAGPPPGHSGSATLACFAIREKISPAVLEAWAEILRCAPSAHLLLKSRFLRDPQVNSELEGFFERRGISRSRLTFLGYTPGSLAHLTYYRQTDLMLDPYPYNGTTATCEALWAGVPVLTWCGRTHVSRVGASLLTQVGLEDLIATSADDYVEKAVRFVSLPSRVARWRGELRRRMIASPLTDGHRLARSIEDRYWEMWRA